MNELCTSTDIAGIAVARGGVVELVTVRIIGLDGQGLVKNPRGLAAEHVDLGVGGELEADQAVVGDRLARAWPIAYSASLAGEIRISSAAIVVHSAND